MVDETKGRITVSDTERTLVVRAREIEKLQAKRHALAAKCAAGLDALDEQILEAQAHLRAILTP